MAEKHKKNAWDWDPFILIQFYTASVIYLMLFIGNLEMTLASRLSTEANLGLLDEWSEAQNIGKANLALVQIQGIVVGGLAAIFALISNWLPTLK